MISKFIRSHGISLILLGVISLWGLQALFHPGLFTAHDIWHQVARLYHYSQALKDGQFPPLWIATLANGYGYPLFIFSYHIPWLFVAPLVAFQLLTVEVALKLGLALGFVFSGVSMYAAVSTLTKKPVAAAGAAIIYLIAPYHFLTLFVAAAIGSVWAFVWVPLIFWGGWWLMEEKHWRLGALILAPAVTGLLLSHLLTAAMVLPVLGVMWLAHAWSQRRQGAKLLFHWFAAGALTFILAAWYLVPLMVYVPAIKAQEHGSGLFGLYHSNFPTLRQLLYSPWGYGPITERASDGEISLQVGLAQWAVLALAGAVVVGRALVKKYFQRFLESDSTELLIAAGVGLMLTLFLMLQISEPLWEFGNRFVGLDYPFRLLLLAIFCTSLAFGWALAQLKKPTLAWVAVGAMTLFAVYANRNHIRVNLYTDFPLSLYVAAETTTNTFHEYLPRTAEGHTMELPSAGILAPAYTDEQLLARGITTSPATVSAQVTALHQTTREMAVRVEATQAATIALKQFAFPDMVLRVNGVITPYQTDRRDLILVDLPVGQTTFLVRFEPRAWVQLVRALSLLSWGGASGSRSMVYLWRI